MRLSDSWLAHFHSLESNELGNKNMSSFTSATIATDTTTPDSIQQTLTEDIDVIFLMITPITRQIKLLHSPTIIGGTRLRAEKTLMALDGFGRSAQPVIIDSTSITTTISVKTPTASSLRQLTSIESIDTLTAPSNSRNTLKNTPFLILPPFIATALAAQDERTPANVLLLCLELINQFDTDHDEDDTFTITATEACKNILSFLWSSSKNLIPPVTFVPGSDLAIATSWSSQRHHACLTPLVTSSDDSDSSAVPGVSAEIIQTLAYSINSQTDVLEQMRQDKQDASTEKQSKFNDLHDSTKQMILNASSTDGETTPDEPTEHCTEFFKKKNISKALDYLQTTLERSLECCAHIDTGLATALYAGHFLREREDSPSNFSFFLTPKKQPLAGDRFRPTMILQLKANQGQGWSETDLKEALKQGIVTPTDIHNFSHQLKNFWGLATFFFGPQSMVSTALSPLLKKISQHTLTFEGAQCRDPQFVTKLGYAIDTRVFRWLDQCRALPNRVTINDNLLAFDTLIDQVLTDSFCQMLPTTFKDFSLSQTQPNHSHPNASEHTNEQRPRKQRRTNTDTNKERIMNTKQIQEWIAPPEEYRQQFIGKFLDMRPRLNNKPMCQRFHSKGYCFSDCMNKTTHVPSQDIDLALQKQYRKYVEKCKHQL